MMVFFNHATRQMTAKIVYYGPGLCGKTTNLNTIYGKTSPKARGEMVSLNTETDRTLFFDLLPMDVGVVGGFKTKLQLYTVPGQVFYNSTRKLVLKGVDGIVFVADSQSPMLDANKESLQNLSENMRELGLDLREIPMVFQWNKRDLKNTVTVSQLEEELNPAKHPSFQAIASDGTGVFETLRGVTKLVLSHIKTHVLGESAPAKESREPKDAKPLEPPVSEPPALEPPEPPAPEPSAFLPPVPQPPASDPAPVDVTPEGQAGLAVAEPEPPLPPAKPSPLPATPVRPVTPIQAHPPASRPLQPAKPLALHLPSAPVAPKLAPRPMLSPNPKAAVSALLGDMTHAGMFGTPSVLRLQLPAELDGAELEIEVQVKVKGQSVAHGSLKKPTPGKGILSKLTLELKRG